jgi:regulator of replication initiation timing
MKRLRYLMDIIKNLLKIIAGVPIILAENGRLRKENTDLKKQLADQGDFEQLKAKESEIENLTHDIDEATTEPSMSSQ